MKNKEEGDKNSSYGISNTSFIIIIYDDAAIVSLMDCIG